MTKLFLKRPLKTVDARHPLQQETQLSLTNRATHLCKRNGVAELLKCAPPHMCYRTEFGRSA